MKGNKINFRIFDLLDSTNCEAKRLAANKHPEVWLLALKQSDGRGRRGKKWLSGDGNFTASLLSYPIALESQFSLFSYVAGISLYETVIKLGVSKNDLFLKWPNDLLLHEKKIGGILLERAPTLKTGEKPLVVGFGLNLVNFPNLNDLDLDSLSASSLKFSASVLSNPQEVLDILMTNYKKWNDIFYKLGFSNICDAFLERTIPIGHRIRVKIINKVSYGSFSGINNDGSLILDTSEGIVFVTAGDVSLVGN